MSQSEVTQRKKPEINTTLVDRATALKTFYSREEVRDSTHLSAESHTVLMTIFHIHVEDCKTFKPRRSMAHS